MDINSNPLKAHLFDIKHYAVNDGPGIRTTIFFKGCPLRCSWCHNPESQAVQNEIMLHPNHCIACGACIEACLQQAITPNEPIDRQRCIVCAACVNACYTGARQLVGYDLDLEQLWAQIERDRPFHDQSGGGVTFSGGEPLMQPVFVKALAERCHEHNVHTALDTSGFADWKIIESLLPLIDLFLYDLKLMDNDRHRQYTAVPNHNILNNLKEISGHGSRIALRMPLIAGINDDQENISQMIKFLNGLPQFESLTLMRYHTIGTGKYSALGKINPLPDAEAPDEIIINSIRQQFEQAGIRTQLL